MSACTVNAINSKFNFLSKADRNDPPVDPKKSSFHWAVTTNPEEAYKSHKIAGTLWNTAAYVSAFAYGIISTGGCIVASIMFGPIYAPLSALAALSFLGPAGECFTALQNKAKVCFEKMREEKFAAEKVAELRQLDSSKLESVLSSMDVPVYSVMRNNPISDLHTLAPLIGRHDYWKDVEKDQLKKSEELLKDAGCTASIIKKSLLLAFERKELAYAAKVKAAFYLFLLRDPSFKGDLNSICSLYMPDFTERQLGIVYEKKMTPDPFVLFNNKDKGVIGIAELEKMSTSDLAKKLYEAAPKSMI